MTKLNTCKKFEVSYNFQFIENIQSNENYKYKEKLQSKKRCKIKPKLIQSTTYFNYVNKKQLQLTHLIGVVSTPNWCIIIFSALDFRIVNFNSMAHIRMFRIDMLLNVRFVVTLHFGANIALILKKWKEENRIELRVVTTRLK